MKTTMKKRGWCLGALLLFDALAFAGGIGTWRNFTSMKDVRGIARDGNTYWAATSGGLFNWSPADGSYRLFTNAEGLLSIDLTALGIDGTGQVWTGASSGAIHLLSPGQSNPRTILDIFNANQTNKAINAFTFKGDTALICTDFGLSLFRISKFEFGDTYSKFGPGSSGIRFSVLSAAIFGNNIWASISDGQTINRVAVASLSNPNLLPPESWTLQTVGDPGNVIRNLAVFDGRLYAGTLKGLYVYDGSNWNLNAAAGSRDITTLASSPTALVFSAGTNQTYTLNAQGTVAPYGTPLPYPALSVTADPDGKPIVGSSGAGILLFDGSWISRQPNGPNSNGFVNVAVDPDGNVWGASGQTAENGFYRYDGKEWKSFTTTNSPLLSNNIHRLSVDCDGGLWASTFGRGVIEVPFRSTAVDSSHVYWHNVGFVGLPNDPDFVVVGNVVCDGRGNRWMSVINPVDKRALTVRKSNGTWLHIPAYIGGARMSYLMDVSVDKALAVDAYDNLWAIVRDASYKGVISLGNQGTIDSTAAFLITVSSGLPSDDIRTIVVDKDNTIWVGTDKGIAIILDPVNPTRQGGIAAYKPLTGLVVNTIAVDALNQKWVGTNEGAVLLSADGTQVLTSLTLDNTQGKLIDNNISSIAVDQRTGTVYFGTSSGLASLTTSAAAPKTLFDGLRVYPNPFRVPGTVPLTVDGLMQNSRIRILTSDGRLVRDIASPGGRIGFWDGKDARGNDVASGIYLIVAYTEDGQVANGKVAVLRN
jgi:ligand-binding sensor domain-containing protein